MIAGAVLALASLAMAPALRERVTALAHRGVRAARTFSGADAQPREDVISLPEMEICALQLGVYESGERAQSEMNRLTAQGIPCIIWQREQMRIICSAARKRSELDMWAASGMDACVIAETLPQVQLRIAAGEQELETAKEMLLLPDDLFARLFDIQEDGLAYLVGKTRMMAEPAAKAHPENEWYTQLAVSLLGWCDLMDRTIETCGVARALAFARATMCTLCRELRVMLNA